MEVYVLSFFSLKTLILIFISFERVNYFVVGDGICFISIFKINEQISDHPSKDKAHISQNDFLWSFNNIKWRTPPTNDNKIFLLHRNSDVHTFNNKLSEDKISSLVQVFRFIGRGEIQASIESVRKLLKMIKI